MKNDYIGSELTLFAHAINWKNYFTSVISKYIYGNVLEVGAGIGGTTKVLYNSKVENWTCIEPDSSMAPTLQNLIDQGELPKKCSVIQGTIEDTPLHAQYDSILYIDVLEHIKDDRSEVKKAIQKLNPGGVIIIISPAFQFLYSPFDKSIGHFRRYNKQSLAELFDYNLICEKLMYIDSVGALLSTTNRLLLKSNMPTVGQISFWDKIIVRISKIIDILINYSFGRSIIGVWRKQST